MELHYRGAIYESTSTPIETNEGEVVGHYRGAAFRFCQLRRILVQEPRLHLKYRGAEYDS
jgi:hypothetical protein